MIKEFLLSSPMEQFVIYPVFSLDLSLGPLINNVVLAFSTAGLITWAISLSYKPVIGSTAMGVFHESLFMTILSMLENYVGRNYGTYLPLLYTIFFLILFSNLLGMTAYSTTATVEIIMTLSLSFSLLAGILILGVRTHKSYLFAAFLPAGTPLALVPFMTLLETVAFVIKILSLGLRLAINLTTGHVLVKTILGFMWDGYLGGTSIIILALPLSILVLFLGLEILICYLQSYIFVFIVCITMKDII